SSRRSISSWVATGALTVIGPCSYSREMRFTKTSRVLETEAQHAVEPDMGQPNQRKRYKPGAVQDPCHGYGQGKDFSVDKVIKPGPQPRVPQIPDHRDIRNQKQGEKNPPGIPTQAVDNRAAQEDACAFRLKQPFRLSHHLAVPPTVMR